MGAAHTFLRVKVRGLSARLHRLGSITPGAIGLRPQDMRHAPTPGHFAAANRRLDQISRQARQRYAQLAAGWRDRPAAQTLIDVALVERELDRARRAYGLFFEVFAQRGTVFAPALSAHDAIAIDCYAAVRQAAPRIFAAPVLKPLCYMEHGFSPATMRRGVTLARLLGEPNPFPLIRIPWDREHPWQAVFLHEVAHNLQADLGVWQENREGVVRRVLGASRHRLLATIYGRWHKEIFADLAAILLGGPAAAWGMAEFLANPAPRVLTYRPGGAHPTAYLRALILAEMLRRMGFGRDAARMAQVWRTLYDRGSPQRLPAVLLHSAGSLIPQVVDEIAFQTRRNLAQRALVDIIRFGREEQAAILQGARFLMQGRPAQVRLPPRFLVSAASYALAQGRMPPEQLSQQVIGLLNDASLPSPRAVRPQLALAA